MFIEVVRYDYAHHASFKWVQQTKLEHWV